MKKVFLLLVLAVCFNLSFGQSRYWIEFKDKNIENYDFNNYLSTQTIENRIKFDLPLYQYSDVPVNVVYLDSLKGMGIELHVASKWLNSVSASLSNEQINQVQHLGFVDTIYGIDPNIKITSADVKVNAANYASYLKQMNAPAFAKQNLTGKGVRIGVIDAGFFRTYSDKSLQHLMKYDRIKLQRDFVNPDRKDIINEAASDADIHGTMVLKRICGYDEKDNTQSGLAVNAFFYLARSEDGSREHRGEEDQWIQAMEWMDSLGVRLINTSLGYAINMDDAKDNYTKEEMDGKTARISRAAQIASDEKGIFLVVSAGNEGNNSKWGIVSAPADAEGVLSVGATKERVWERIGYSSIGPDFLPYLKPNVSCYSPNGTSFSAPAVAGFVACLMEKAPDISNKELKKIVEKSAHLYPFGNNFLGYGVPQADRALKLLENPSHKFTFASEKHVKDNSYVVKGKRKYLKDAVVFHKSNERIVVKQEVLRLEKPDKKKKNEVQFEIYMDTEVGEAPKDLTEKQLKRYNRKQARRDNKIKRVNLKRPEGVNRSTIIINNSVLEVIWE
ncbi:MAG: S8 family serine peptidase [Cytophagaceae bacterium]